MSIKYASILFFRSEFFITLRRKKNETNLKKKTCIFTTKVGTCAVTGYPCLFELSE